MALDPRLVQMLAAPDAQLAAPPPEVTPAMMRAGIKEMLPKVAPPPVHAVHEFPLATRTDVTLRAYFPTADRAVPAIVFFHGGGFVVGDLDTHDALCRALALASRCAVVSVAYRLAPEARFPEPLEDCHAAVAWIATAGHAHGIDGTRIAVCGDSAGANLATAVTMLARDRAGPAIRHQCLFYPALDAHCASASMRDLATGYWISSDLMRWFWNAYLRGPEDALDPLAVPVHATRLDGLPPAHIVTAEFDPLRDEGEAYADALRAAGVGTTTHRAHGMIHGFLALPCVADVADATLADAAARISAALQP